MMYKIIGVCVIVVLMIVIIAQSIINRKRIEKENKRMNELIEKENQKYQELVIENRNLKRIRHDLNAQIRMAKRLSVQSEEVLSKMPEKERVIAFLFAEKETLYEKEEVAFTKELPERMRWNDVALEAADLLSLFENLLNNAYEACIKTSDPFIYCRVVDGEDALYVFVENSKSDQISPEETGYQTTKLNKEFHGFGLSIIEQIVGKCNGTVNKESLADTFSIDIKIPMRKGVQ